MTPTERLLAILRFISRANDNHTVASGSTIRERMGDVYKGDSGRRMWRRDLRVLRDRGLIETDVTTATTPNRDGIRSRLPLKPERLHLTLEEHTAIQEARQVLRQGIPEASPLSTSSDDPRREVADVLNILRFLEENGDEVEISVLADWLKVPTGEAFQLMDTLTHEGVFDDQLVASLEFVPMEADDDGPPKAVQVFRGLPPNSRRPMRNLGLAKLGFFPYSLSETNERLSLIEQALKSNEISEELKSHLRRAAGKLSEWKWQFPR